MKDEASTPFPPLRPLVEVLKDFGASEALTCKMSTKWQARVAPLCKTREEIFERVTSAVPALLEDERYAAGAFEKLGGECALEYFCGTSTSTKEGQGGEKQQHKFSFQRPKIAFLGGWGGPGTNPSSEEYLSLVQDFSDVVNPDNSTPKNLQMFHRDDSDVLGLPVLPRELKWPLPELLGVKEEREREKEECAKEDRDDANAAVVVDNATRLSQKGAITWWHLDDGGEFVLQVGLPLKKKKRERENDEDEEGDGDKDGDKDEDKDEDGDRGKPVVKIFIFAPKSHYKMIMQDLETNKTGRSACLELFKTPSEYLPEIASGERGGDKGEDSDRDEDDVLPVFWVAPLRAGGYPLLSPPNAPHMVLTVQDCVMVEQRRISKVFLDEVEYFLRRAERWNAPPICYDFIQKDLQDVETIRRAVVRPLVDQVESYLCKANASDSISTSSSPDPEKLPREELQTAVRICCSLKSLLVREFFPQEDELRASISNLVDTFSDYLHLDTREKERQLLIQDMGREGENGLYTHTNINTHKAHGNQSYFALVHEKGCPRWGPHRSSREQALKDRKKLKRACMERKLPQVLLDMKSQSRS